MVTISNHSLFAVIVRLAASAKAPACPRVLGPVEAFGVDGTGLSGIPETVEAYGEAAAYWIARFRGE